MKIHNLTVIVIEMRGAYAGRRVRELPTSLEQNIHCSFTPSASQIAISLERRSKPYTIDTLCDLCFSLVLGLGNHKSNPHKIFKRP